MVSFPIVLLIFMSSNHREGNVDSGIMATTGAYKALNDPKGSENNGGGFRRIVNDLTLTDFTFSNDHLKEETPPHKKIVRENTVTAELKTHRGKAPVPLYSLVKNVCEKGYVMDENGVCQRAVTLRNEKKFDYERKRRRRFAQDFELLGQRNLKAFIRGTTKSGPKKDAIDKLKGNDVLECNKIHSELVSDGIGGCKKSNQSKRFITP